LVGVRSIAAGVRIVNSTSASHRLMILSRALWTPGGIVGVGFFSFNAYVTFTGVYCCGTPWDNFPWLNLIVIFGFSMLLALAGMIIRRIIARPSLAQNVLWVAAALAWCGMLMFGIGAAGSNFYVSWAEGGGAVMFFLWIVGSLVIVLSLCLGIAGLIGMAADATSKPRRPHDANN
jgi:hypothetical protein